MGLPLPNVDRWEDFNRKFVYPNIPERLTLPEDVVNRVQNLLGHQFTRPELLYQALVRSCFRLLNCPVT